MQFRYLVVWIQMHDGLKVRMRFVILMARDIRPYIDRSIPKVVNFAHIQR